MLRKLKIGQTIVANPKMGIMLDRLRELTDRAETMGLDAPQLNLSEVVMPGNPFMDHLGVDRERMPQLKMVPLKGSPADKLEKDAKGEVDCESIFLDELAKSGIVVKYVDIPVVDLKPTQNHLCGAKVSGMVHKLRDNPKDTGINKPIFVSSDNYILDGHHRWAALAAYQMETNAVVKMKVMQVGIPVAELLPLANAFVKKMGLLKKEAHANVVNYTKVGTCLDIDKPNNPLSKLGDASKWDKLTNECKPITRAQFLALVGKSETPLASKGIQFGKHPKHEFVWVEVPHKDNVGTVHHYYFKNE